MIGICLSPSIGFIFHILNYSLPTQPDQWSPLSPLVLVLYLLHYVHPSSALLLIELGYFSLIRPSYSAISTGFTPHHD